MSSDDSSRFAQSGEGAEADVSPTGAVLPCARTWIEIELLGEDGLGVADEVYALELPSGDVRRGKLDARGRARVDGIQAGTCVVRFPNLDREAWEPA